MNTDKLITDQFVNELLKNSSWDVARTRPEPIIEDSTTEGSQEEEVVEEEATAVQLAEELLANLSDDVIKEFVNLLHTAVLTEAEKEEEGDEIDEAFVPLFKTIDESFTALEEEYDISESTFEDIMEAVIDSLDEDDIEDYTADEVMEALIHYLEEKKVYVSDTEARATIDRQEYGEKHGRHTKNSMKKRAEVAAKYEKQRKRATGGRERGQPRGTGETGKYSGSSKGWDRNKASDTKDVNK